MNLQALPLEAQLSPVFGIVVDDFDGDNKKDIWLGGNFYALKPQAGRHNASKGVLLKQVANGQLIRFLRQRQLVLQLPVRYEMRLDD